MQKQKPPSVSSLLIESLTCFGREVVIVEIIAEKKAGMRTITSLADQRRILWNCSIKYFASVPGQCRGMSADDTDLPSGAVNVNWYLLLGPFGSLYPSQKM
jgi:hypothetical protein